MNRQQTIQEISSIQRRYEVKYFPKVRKVIQKEVDRVASIVEHEGIAAARRYLDGHLHSKDLPEVIRELYIEVGGRFARKQWISLRAQRLAARKNRFVSRDYELKELKGFGFNEAWVRWILDYLHRYLIDKITFAVAKTTKDALLVVLSRSVTEGWGIDKTVRNLSDLPLSRTQSARIVRTEITRATNTGISAAGETFDFEQTKEWVAAHDKRTRGQEKNPHASHVLLDGQVIDYEKPFIDPINGDELMFPGDPKGSAASVINCRCRIVLVAKVDQDGRLIPKKQKELV